MGERRSLHVDVTGSRPFTYLWMIDGHKVSEGPTDVGGSTISYDFNKEGIIWVDITVTNPYGSDNRAVAVSVVKKWMSMQFTKQPPGLIAPGDPSIEWCINYKNGSGFDTVLIAKYGDGGTDSKSIYNQEGTVCFQHIYQKTGSYDVSFTLSDPRSSSYDIIAAELHQGIAVAGCPLGFVLCGKDCMPQSMGCCAPAPGYCEVKPLCCGGGCCTTSQFCHEGVCCAVGMVGCPGQAGCCSDIQNCCTGGCCDGPCCAGGCCLKGDQCCGGKCCDAGYQCCNGGTHCCPPGKICTASGCADPQCLPAACCPERPVPCPSTCCAPGMACCVDGCMAAGRTCCGTYSCKDVEDCCAGGCMPKGNDCCGDGTSCPAGSVCCGDGCCPTSAVCAAGSCCAKGSYSCGNGTCCPTGYSCCPSGGCCPGNSCGPVKGQCSGAAQSLPQLQSEGVQRIAPSPQ